ncbi:MAG: large conductance mechanosensitive channel protein MscL [Cloacibacterium sp.]|nr:large conductance mechanosensitive channel protein MscL [Cloacibacterium sp.]
MGFIQEFKDFAIKGNVVDLAVAVIMGGAFGKIVSSFVDDVVTPLLLNPALKAANVASIAELTWGTVKYGNFLAAVINFTFIAFVMFLMVKVMNKLKKPAEEVLAGPTQEELLTEIRDLLKK